MAQPVDATPDLGIDPTTSKSAGRGIPHIASNFVLVQASSICPRPESSPKRPPNSKKDPKTTKPQAVEKNANRRGLTGLKAVNISAQEQSLRPIDSGAVSANVLVDAGLAERRHVRRSPLIGAGRI